MKMLKGTKGFRGFRGFMNIMGAAAFICWRQGLSGVGAVLLVLAIVQTAHAQLTVTPITWDVVGLDHNRPLTSGPELFPLGARVCTEADTPNVEVELVWDEANAFIDARPGSQTVLQTGPLAEEECFDAYFEIQLTRSASAFGQSRRYSILATDDATELTFSSPAPRAIFIERLVSQNRNSTQLIRWGQEADESDWVTLGTGGGLNLAVGETYFIELLTRRSNRFGIIGPWIKKTPVSSIPLPRKRNANLQFGFPSAAS